MLYWRFSGLISQAFQETTVNALLNATSSTYSREQNSSLAMQTSQKRSDYNIPVTTFLTPSALVSSRLLAYDSDIHLMPAVRTFVKQVGWMCISFSLCALLILIVCILGHECNLRLNDCLLLACFSGWNSAQEIS